MTPHSKTFSALTISLLGGSLMLFGFGCKSPNKPAPAPSVPLGTTGNYPTNTAYQQPTKPTTPVTPPSAASSTAVDPRITYLTQVMRNFASVRAFRAELLIQTSDMPLRAELEAVSRKGMHGILHVGDNLTSEIVLSATDTFFRSNTSSWINLSATPEGQVVADQLRMGLALNEDLTAFLRNSTVVSDADDPSGCRMYTLQKKNANGQMRPITLCTKNDLPVLISFDSPTGHINASYRDYNQPIDIVIPVVNKP